MSHKKVLSTVSIALVMLLGVCLVIFSGCGSKSTKSNKVDLVGKVEKEEENQLTVAEKDGKYGFVDKDGNEVIPFIYDSADEFVEGLARVRKDGKRGFINEEGEVVVPLIYDQIFYTQFSEGLIPAEKDYKYGYVNKNGEEIIPFIYDRAEPFSEGLAVVGISADPYLAVYTYGYINPEGEVVIPMEYSEASNFHQGLAAVQMDGKCGYIDQSGDIVIPCEYDTAGSFGENNEALVTKDGKRHIIDTTGKITATLAEEE